MLTMNDLKVGVMIDLDNTPYQVVWSDFMRTAQRKPVMRTKLRHLITRQVLEKTFKPGDKIDEADMRRNRAQFMYREGDNFNFMDNDSYEQFAFTKEQIGDIGNYVKEGEDVDVMSFNDKPVTISLQPKVSLRVVEAPPGVRGDSSGNVTKKVKLETGFEAAVPLFINEGDIVRINTETGDYVERVNS
ncbi:MAG: elongation factor P [Candidatus Kerfeldbacteria bacterium]|nr:elongation factor P [Candidatus Kerfeldbacteria bacterium]